MRATILTAIATLAANTNARNLDLALRTINHLIGG